MSRKDYSDTKISSFGNRRRQGIPPNAIRKTRSDKGTHVGYTEEELMAKVKREQLKEAAPDMYEVLNDVEKTLGLTLADHFPELRNKIVKVLAKADGKEN